MRVITADEINRVLTYPALIEALREGFRADICSPLRHTHMIPQPSGSEAKYLLMPAWTNSGEASRLQDRQRLSGQHEARQAGGVRQLSPDLGRDRRAARGDGRKASHGLAHGRASALAASYLAREDATHLVMVGAGALAPL